MNIQIPTDVPHPQNNSPVDFTNPFEIILYGVVPVLLIIAYFFLRKRNRKRRDLANTQE